MATVNEIVETLDQLFPAKLAESWDNTGLLLGDAAASVNVGMTALTLTEDVADEACEKAVKLIVAHHPILFRGAKRLTADTPEGRTILKLAAAGVAVYSPHTRFDSAAEGINEYLATELGLKDVAPIRPTTDEEGVGAGRMGALAEPASVSEFAGRVQSVCNVDGLHVVDGGRPVQRVAIACGAAGEYLDDAISAGCDAFVVGECRFHTALEARDAGVSVFVPGHYGTERPAVEWLAIKLAESFDSVRWFSSESETDPLAWLGG